MKCYSTPTWPSGNTSSKPVTSRRRRATSGVTAPTEFLSSSCPAKRRLRGSSGLIASRSKHISRPLSKWLGAWPGPIGGAAGGDLAAVGLVGGMVAGGRAAARLHCPGPAQPDALVARPPGGDVPGAAVTGGVLRAAPDGGRAQDARPVTAQDFGMSFFGSINGFGTTVACRSPTPATSTVNCVPRPACSIGTIA